MSSSQQLDDVIARLERAAEQLRSGELSADAAATLVEMLHPQEAPGDEPIPAEGAIEEAVESAKRFCGPDAPGFVNGVLAAVLREVRENGGVR